MFAIFNLVLHIVPCLSALAKLEPPNEKLIFGAWIDTSNGPFSGGDSFAAFNDRIGFNTGSFQVWQMLPPRPPVNGPPDYDLANHNPDGTFNFDLFTEGTNASIFLTVYPQGLSNITVSHLTELGVQCNNLTNTLKRDLFLRLGPEMNGDWFVYGRRPEEYVAFWKRAHGIISKLAPQVAFVWSPNYNGPADQSRYEPYWPGPEYVDWVGISLYWKGSVLDYPWWQNKVAPSNFVAQLIDAADGPEGGPISFYEEYAVRFDKPLVISESAGAFHLGIRHADGSLSALDPGVGRLQTVMSFWNSFLFNPEFLKRLKTTKQPTTIGFHRIQTH
ncbi:glycoside hydrolase superfamily [Obelidium mucronatum]|nr:glycoside hydrolase superfamily [Obelidium mucronatum]